MKRSRFGSMSGAALMFGVTCLAINSPARAAVDATMTTPTGSSATVRIVMTITTSLGTSTDDDTRVMATMGSAHAAFLSNLIPFHSSQFNAMDLSFANTNFVLNFFCIPFFGCQVLTVTVNDLRLELAEPTCSAIATGGAVAYPAVVRMTGSYITSGIASASGSFDNTGPGAINGRITNPTAGTVRLDQIALAEQTIDVDPATLPAGVTALRIVIQPNLANTTLAGPFARSQASYDLDADGLLDACDPCNDTDGDGFGDPDLPNSSCAIDNCPHLFNPDQLDVNNNGIGDACEAPLCPADIAPIGGDGAVGVPDLLAIISNWGNCPAVPAVCTADIAPAGGDGAVGVPDLLAIISAWGVCPL